MKYTFSILILALTFIILSCGNNKNKGNNESKNPIVDDYSDKIDSLILITNPRKFNGIVLITQNGETKYSKEYGFSDFKKKTPISINDNFRIQSNSKQVTAVLILKEVEKGNIVLQKPFKEYIPDFKQSWADTVTVHQLLNMSSGIIALDKPLIFEPGTDYKYSNPAYGLLGRIIKNVTGNKYSEVANNLFQELKMNNSYCYEIIESETKLINGYEYNNNDFNLVMFNELGITKEGWVDFVPAGGIISSPKDLNIWDTKLHNGKILKPETYELMTNYSVTGQHDAFGSKKIGYGYGLQIDNNNPLKIIGHAGRGLGFVNIKFYVPEKNLDVIVLENIHTENDSIVYHFEKEIRKIVLNSNLLK